MVYPRDPILVRRWWRGLDIFLPKSGAAAHVYYRRFSSRTKLATLVEIVRPGMVTLDIGAHAGEYTLILARLCGPAGFVHAFEPQSDLARIVRQNAGRNGLTNIRVHEAAVGELAGTIGFVTNHKSRGGWTAGTVGTSASNETHAVPQIPIDHLIEHEKISRIDFIKLDAAGNELAALRGARGCIAAMKPTIMCQLYNPEVVRDRHGYSGELIVGALQESGYAIWLLSDALTGGRVPVTSMADVLPQFKGSQTYSLTLLAMPPR